MKSKIIYTMMFLGLVLPNYMYAWKYRFTNMTGHDIKIRVQERNWGRRKCVGKLHEITVAPKETGTVRTTCCMMYYNTGSEIKMFGDKRVVTRGWNHEICGGRAKVNLAFNAASDTYYYEADW